MSLASLFKRRKQDEDGPVISGAEMDDFPSARSDFAAARAGIKYAHQLQRGGPNSVSGGSLVDAWEALEEDMALVPAGEIAPRAGSAPGERPPYVAALFIDRCAVTNAQFATFVAEGGYDAADLWPEEVWPNVAQFVDHGGYPGPKYWDRGRCPKKLGGHPVVGVCWYEANAYAVWAGKRLPSSIEWERAGTWPTNLDDQATSVRYPWGNSFDPKRANIWSSGHGGTVEANAYRDGCTPNGVYQLVGNVWEWVADEYLGPAVREGLRIFLDQQMAEIRGGSYDTYFDAQATCRFRTGQPLLFRGPNVGFRCVLSADDLRRPADVSGLG
jgi:formylglycine-generating enzyme required for sulfatase activity